MKPKVKLSDQAFRYTPSFKTNLRKTFRRERARLAAEREKSQVVPISKRVSK